MSFALTHQSKSKEAHNKISKPVKPSPHPRGVNSLSTNSHDSIIHLQRTIGNQAVQRFMRSVTGFVKTGIQAKLKVSQPGDMYEQEADKVAEQIMGMSCTSESHMPTKSSDNIEVYRKRKSGEEEETKKVKIRRKKNNDSSSDPKVSNNVIKDIESAACQQGSPLDSSTKDFMESRFGYDFSKVRIHIVECAAISASSVNALAYRLGNDIISGRGTINQSPL